eukprot:maker-scaffold_13-snap-gene-5.4-mRNA-1 protein AED:0.01 eAED:0.01 QI:108/1/1/1/0.5/0.33/3/159/585
MTSRKIRLNGTESFDILTDDLPPKEGLIRKYIRKLKQRVGIVFYVLGRKLVFYSLLSSALLSSVSAYLAHYVESLVGFSHGFLAAEKPQMTILAQLFSLFLARRFYGNWGLSSAKRLTKFLAFLNLALIGLQLDLLRTSFYSFFEFRRAFKLSGLSTEFLNVMKVNAVDSSLNPTKISVMKPSAFLALCLSLLPIKQFKLHERGLHYPSTKLSEEEEVVAKRFTKSYAEMEKIDPSLLSIYKELPKKVKKAFITLGRGKISEWLDLDILRNDDLIRKFNLSKLSSGSVKKVPVLIYFHGGGWMTCSKEFGLRGTLDFLAANFNIILVKANYRMAPEVSLAEIIIDMKRAIHWVKSNIEKYGGDPDQVCIGGESAGGHISALQAMTNDIEDFPMFKPEELKDEPAEKFKIDLVIDIYGNHDFVNDRKAEDAIANIQSITDTRIRKQTTFLAESLLIRKKVSSAPELYQLLSPHHLLLEKIENAKDGKSRGSSLPPVLLVHGNTDVLTSHKGTCEFYHNLKKWREISGDTEFKDGKEIKDIFVDMHLAHHGFGYIESPRAISLALGMASFMQHYFSDLEQSSSYSKF